MAEPLQREDYSFAVTLLSPLHVGSGGHRHDLLPPIEDATGTQDVAVQTIQRDAGGKPWIPASTLKGMLRGLAAGLDPDIVTRLLGVATNADTGTMGALLVRGASMIREGRATGLPCAATLGKGVYVASRSAIDGGRGISAPNKLFHAEMVAPGAQFEVRLRLETRGAIEPLRKALLTILGNLAGPGQVAIGADQASGQGALQLTGPVTSVTWRAGINGFLVAARTTTLAATPDCAPSGASLRLHCPGPYLSRDPAWTKADREKAQQGTNGFVPHIRPLRRDKVPLISGASVAGALRARLDWLLAADHVRQGNAPPAPRGMVRSLAEADALAPVERLFGATGFRGVLRVSVNEVSAAPSPARLTSARMDRFAGGTIDAALFGIEADRDVRFTLTLGLDARAKDRDRDALDRLVADLRSNGLCLGHGTARGFGWFKVEG